MMRKTLLLLAMAAGSSLASPAQALCVLCTCSASTTGLAFGPYDPSSPGPRDANATVTINCSGVAALLGNIDVALSPGGASSIPLRRMVQGSEQLVYNIYSDATYTALWGDGSGGTAGVSLPFNGLLSYTATVTAYGRIPTHQYVKPGPYTDTVTVTVTY
ncbi:spore coat U domain-containing protein [Novosphingobium sp. RL4]|uniref:Csu type fimbrial protein n=1 Tax=Novosphingobium sp. RL4 TaxID=3109595 RepID=UPI002D79C0F4|nr:spore coat U domain-containing protein [Novosphingobium sp. RL4]WRT95134.1 spore coat U domain-containing protein [Novosphingobium sp. RL4]